MTQEEKEERLLKVFKRLKEEFNVPNDIDGLMLWKLITERVQHVIDASDGKTITFAEGEEAADYFRQQGRNKEFIDALPLVIRKAIELYTSAGFDDINKGFLRKNKGLVRNTGETVKQVNFNTMDVKEFYLEGVVDALDFLLSLSITDKDMVLYRGTTMKEFTDLGIEEESELSDAIDEGKTYTNHAYTSTTACLGGRFINESPVVMVIRVPRGTNYCYLNGSDLAIQGEMEVVLGREMEFLLCGMEKINGKTYVYVEAIPKRLKRVPIEDIKMTDPDKVSDLEIVPLYEEEEDFDMFDFDDDSSFGL